MKTNTAEKIDVREVPTAFSNAINELGISFDWANWRKSNEWKMYVRGFNAAVEESNAAVRSKFNMGKNAERLFGA